MPRAMTPEGIPFGMEDLVGSKVSPDGRFVVARSPAGSSPRYAFFPTAGGAPVSIPGIGEADLPVRWSGDGRFLFVRGDPSKLPARLERLDLQTGSRQPWKELRPPDSTGVSSIGPVVLAPDGGAYFYGIERGLSTLYLVEGLH